MYSLSMSDASPTTATSGTHIGGIDFGTAGRGAFPPWLLAVAVVGLVFVMTQKRKG